MSYEAMPRVIKVKLRGTEFDGVEARAEVPPLGDMLGAQKTDQAIAGLFAEHLESWNITVKGDPVPATVDGLHAIDATLGLSLAIGWYNEITNVRRDNPFSEAQTEALATAVAAKLGNPTTNGTTTEPPAAGVEMEAL